MTDIFKIDRRNSTGNAMARIRRDIKTLWIIYICIYTYTYTISQAKHNPNSWLQMLDWKKRTQISCMLTLLSMAIFKYAACSSRRRSRLISSTASIAICDTERNSPSPRSTNENRDYEAIAVLNYTSGLGKLLSAKLMPWLMKPL